MARKSDQKRSMINGIKPLLVRLPHHLHLKLKRIHCPERLFAPAFETAVHALRLIDDQDGPDRPKSISLRRTARFA